MYNISIIDDDREILALLEMLLTDKYKISLFNSIDNALNNLDTLKKSDIVILDYSIDGKTCDDILQYIPDSKIIIMSGYSKDSSFIINLSLKYNFNFIKKPFSFKEIILLTEKILSDS